jgi:hypothetical protein
MVLRSTCLVVLAAVLVVAGRADEPVVVVKRSLPPGFRKLGLSADQTKEIYRVRGSYQVKIQELQAKIEQLKKEEKAALVGLLTPEQKQRLREIRTAEVPQAQPAAPPGANAPGSPAAPKSEGGKK